MVYCSMFIYVLNITSDHVSLINLINLAYSSFETDGGTKIRKEMWYKHEDKTKWLDLVF